MPSARTLTHIAGGGDLCANAATKTWGTTVAAAFGAEYSQVGFGSLGWTVAGAGGVPPFYIPGNEVGSSWYVWSSAVVVWWWLRLRLLSW